MAKADPNRVKAKLLSQTGAKVRSFTDKENSMCQSNGTMIKPYFSGQKKTAGAEDGILGQVVVMLAEIKNQNQYLIERNTELENLIEGDVRSKIEEGFAELREEIRSLKKIVKT